MIKVTFGRVVGSVTASGFCVAASAAPVAALHGAFGMVSTVGYILMVVGAWMLMIREIWKLG